MVGLAAGGGRFQGGGELAVWDLTAGPRRIAVAGHKEWVECVALAAEACELCLTGNHDLVVLGQIDVEAFSPSAAEAARWTRDHINDESVKFVERTLAQLETR